MKRKRTKKDPGAYIGTGVEGGKII